MLLRFVTAIQLTRLTMALGAVSNVWFVILLTRAMPHHHHLPMHSMSLWLLLPAGAMVAIGLFAYAAALNDVLDLRHDAAFEPARPLPAGRIRVSQAMVIAIAALIVAVLGSMVFRTSWAPLMTLVVATLILFYNTAGKFIPAVGIVTVGLIHAGHMFIANHELDFTLPVWLILSHSMGIALVVYQLEDKRPVLTRRSLLGVSAGWVFWSGVVLIIGIEDNGIWPASLSLWSLGLPVLCVLGFIGMARYKARRVSQKSAAEKLKRYGAMWQGLYDAAWLAALGLTMQASALGLFALAGFTLMTLLKELSGLSASPSGYRA